jgi:hypothetical protein
VKSTVRRGGHGRGEKQRQGQVANTATATDAGETDTAASNTAASSADAPSDTAVVLSHARFELLCDLSDTLQGLLLLLLRGGGLLLLLLLLRMVRSARMRRVASGNVPCSG